VAARAGVSSVLISHLRECSWSRAIARGSVKQIPEPEHPDIGRGPRVGRIGIPGPAGTSRKTRRQSESARPDSLPALCAHSFEGFWECSCRICRAFQAAVAHHEQNVEIVLRGEQALPMSISARTMATAKRSLRLSSSAPPDLVRRHVAVLAFQRAGLGLGLALLRGERFRRSPSFTSPALGDEHVGGRNVAMNQVHGLALDVFALCA